MKRLGWLLCDAVLVAALSSCGPSEAAPGVTVGAVVSVRALDGDRYNNCRVIEVRGTRACLAARGRVVWVDFSKVDKYEARGGSAASNGMENIGPAIALAVSVAVFVAILGWTVFQILRPRATPRAMPSSPSPQPDTVTDEPREA